MSQIKILSDLERRAFDNPPKFTSIDRKRFFDVPVGLKKVIDKLRTPTNRVCFLAVAGYFRASKRFYARKFNDEDIIYISKKLLVDHQQVDVGIYDKETFQRHKKLVLEYFGFREFNFFVREELRLEIGILLRSQKRPKLILEHIVESILRQRIAIPTYFTLYTLIANEIHKHQQELTEVIEKKLSSDARLLLDNLFEQGGESTSQHYKRYRLTLLKRFSQALKPKQIKSNVEDIATLRKLYQELEEVIDALDLTHEGLRYYAQIVLRTDSANLNRRAEEGKYLHLIAFIAHQYFRGQDILVDTLVRVTQNTINSSNREQKDKLFQERKEQRKSIKNLMGNVEKGAFNPLKKIESITFLEYIPDREKVAQIKQIFLESKQSRDKAKDAAESLEETNQRIINNADYQDALENKSQKLQNRASDIAKQLKFQGENEVLLKAIQHFQSKQGNINHTAPTDFLDEQEQNALINEDDKFRVSLYKALLFIAVADGVKSGTLYLTHSYKYRSLEDYLIPKQKWLEKKDEYIKQAQLSDFADCKAVLRLAEQKIDEAYRHVNKQIAQGKNPHIKFLKDGGYVVNTPKLKDYEGDSLSTIFPQGKYVSLLEVLNTVNKQSEFLDAFEHWKTTRERLRPADRTFFAAIIGYGCNIGLGKIAKISRNISEHELERVINWYLALENIHSANDKVLELMSKMTLPSIYQADPEKLHTSSDGMKYEVSVDSLNTNYSYKYFGYGQGSSGIQFIDERNFLFYAMVISSAEREAPYVIDGLLHNDVVKSDIHSTDTHGYSEIIFGVLHMLGFMFAPRIKNLKKSSLYSFPNHKRKEYEDLGFRLLPDKYINPQLIEGDWDDVLRFNATLKLKVATASQLFKRLSNYTNQHKLYKALKEYGRIHKTLFILKYVTNVEFRQAIEKQLNKGENSNKFSRAVGFDNNQEFLFGEKDQQDIAENCRRLIKNAIIAWNYLYLSQKFIEAPTPQARSVLLEIIRHGSVATWKHVNLSGEYDFSEENLRDSSGLITPKILTLNDLDIWGLFNLS